MLNSPPLNYLTMFCLVLSVPVKLRIDSQTMGFIHFGYSAGAGAVIVTGTVNVFFVLNTSVNVIVALVSMF